MISKKTRIYKETFLTKPRRYSTSKKQVEKSPYMWIDEGKFFHVSYLGMINGLLGKIGWVLVVEVFKETREINKYRFARKWWE